MIQRCSARPGRCRRPGRCSARHFRSMQKWCPTTRFSCAARAVRSRCSGAAHTTHYATAQSAQLVKLRCSARSRRCRRAARRWLPRWRGARHTMGQQKCAASANRACAPLAAAATQIAAQQCSGRCSRCSDAGRAARGAAVQRALQQRAASGATRGTLATRAAALQRAPLALQWSIAAHCSSRASGGAARTAHDGAVRRAKRSGTA